MTTSRENRRVYRADGSPETTRIAKLHWLATYPPWRAPLEDDRSVFRDRIPALSERSQLRGSTYVSSSGFSDSDVDDAASTERASASEEDLINLALILRRPLLVEGDPGVGKSTLAYHIAWMLGLGEPLRWEINSRTTLRDGLYEYRAVEHLRDVQRQGEEQAPPTSEYITLGPLGTAFVPSKLPRVLLVDELDKAQFDLPNDLLHIFEEAQFTVKEIMKERSCEVYPYDYKEHIKGDRDLGRVTVREGTIKAHHHPIVVITSNRERSFSPAFLRRCVKLELKLPEHEQLRQLLKSHFRDAKTQDDVKLFATEEDLDEAITKAFETLNESDEDLSPDQHIQRLFAQVAFDVDPKITDLGTKR